eukprot:1412276-Rhodomonas_salina.2
MGVEVASLPSSGASTIRFSVLKWALLAKNLKVLQSFAPSRPCLVLTEHMPQPGHGQDGQQLCQSIPSSIPAFVPPICHPMFGAEIGHGDARLCVTSEGP